MYSPTWILLFVTLFHACFSGSTSRYVAPSPSDVNFPYRFIPSLTRLINDAGYQHDRHNVTTDDGHILALHRITPKGATSRNRGVPVLIINGFAFQSEGWMALGKSSLPCILTDLGYDVWLGDQRGSLQSLRHVKYDLEDWRNHNYTFHEQGTLDLPAFIDYILNETDRRQLLYVGYSLSSGMLIVMNSERPEYNEKILGATLLAPAGHLKKLTENGFEYSTGIMVVDSMIEAQIKSGQWLLFGNINFVKESFAGCSSVPLNSLCRFLIFNMYGTSETQDRDSMFYQFAMTATTTSVYVGKHLMQVVKHGRFCKYDHGEEKNLLYYGSKSPPNYDFSKTRIPVYMFHSGTDKMVTPDAATRSAKDLNSLMTTKYIDRFNHADYLFSKSAPMEVYEDIVRYFDYLVALTLE